MHDVVSTRLAQVTALCRRFGVRRLELFGSAATDAADPRDLDFLVEFEPLPRGENARAYFGLQRALEDLLGRPVDLVMRSAVANQRFLSAIEAQRTPLYGA